MSENAQELVTVINWQSLELENRPKLYDRVFFCRYGYVHLGVLTTVIERVEMTDGCEHRDVVFVVHDDNGRPMPPPEYWGVIGLTPLDGGLV